MTFKRRTKQERTENTSGFDKLGLGALVYAYAVFLGACYIFAFWRPFGFNVFPYLSVHDYVSAALNRVVVLVALPLFFAACIFGGDRHKNTKLEQNSVFFLVFLYAVGFAKEFYQSVSRYSSTDFKFPNELTVLEICALMLAAGVAIAIYGYRSHIRLKAQIAALVLVQASVSMAAGYADGKAVYDGGMQVYFLENKDLCEPGGVRDWVHVETFGAQTFFMNTVDKRLCITDEKKIRLVSRQRKEFRKPGALAPTSM
jgi:hypothetical protein